MKISFTQWVTSLIVVTLLFSCKDKKEELIEIDPAFSQYISAFTSGVVSAESNIRIILAEESPTAKPGQEIEEEVFDFEPDIEGKAYWIDPRTIEFEPSNPMKSGELYTAYFDLDKFLEVPDEHETFTFQFQTIHQSFTVEVNDFKTYQKTDLTRNRILGTVFTADVIDESVEKVLSAKQNGKKLDITWIHEDRKLHHFQIENVARKEEPGEVDIKWNGDKIDVDNNDGELTFEIPSLSDFKLMDIEVTQYPEQFATLKFSDPLDESQNLNGLIRFENAADNLRFSIEDNQIRVYPPVRQSGSRYIVLSEGIKNILGYKMKEASRHEVVFEEIKPAVRLTGNGVIIPNSNGLILPFEAVNLSAIEVKIIQIFEDNVAQFLQVNNLDGDYQLKRVGRLVHKETVQLLGEKPVDFGKWNAFSLDLSKMIKTQPGAIYKVVFEVKKQYSLYPCDGTEEDEDATAEESTDWDTYEEDESSSWDYVEDYYYYDYYDDGYDWDERDNPCHKSYYMRENRTVSRNILASDLGIIVKGNQNKEYKFIVSDLISTDPQGEVNIELYNYQQQLIGQTTTDGRGMASLKTDQQPFLLIAKKGEQRGYLRLDDGSSLSLGKFDVGGQIVQKGIKGFTYGERGVWRPGDTLFLTFILEDKEHRIPDHHPVSMELINPRGQVKEKIVRSNGLNGFYDFVTVTDPNDPTGNWTAKVRVGGATFTKNLRIETIKPNRLKIKLDFGKDQLTPADKALAAEMDVKWMHGAIARNLKANVKAILAPTPTTFRSFDGYAFDDPAVRFDPEEKTLFDSRINDEGKAIIKTNLDINDQAPGMLKAKFLTHVYEESGEFSIDQFSIPYAPYESFVGIKPPKGDKARGMLLTDTTHRISIATVDANGKKISRDGLEVEVYKVQWRWWWEAGDDDLASYMGRSYTQPIASGKVSTKNGFGTYKFRINYPDWGRYFIRVTDPVSGHSSGKTVYVDWPGWAGRAQRENPEGASILAFSAKKETYKVGEQATVNIPTPKAGRLLISIESGSKMIDAYWVEGQQGETTVQFEVTPEMAPNIFVNATLVQPHAQTANDLPIRMYGVIPITVEDPATELHPQLSIPNELAPEEEFTLRIKEKEGKAMTYTVAIVDEGLLDLTRFKTPNPHDAFYAREALGVKTWDMYDMVLGAYGGRIEQMFGIGGDASEVDAGKKKANRFKPMVKFLGPFHLDKGSTATHKVKMPQYIGSVRTMVIAGYDGAYGATEKTTPVKKPLMLLATMPRVIGPDEELKLPVTVFAMDKKVKNVDIGVKTNGMLQIVGSTKKSVHFNAVGDQVIEFDLKVKPRLGVGKVTVFAKSGSEVAKHEIEINVRNPNPPMTDVTEGIVQPGQAWNTNYTPIGMYGTNEATLEVSRIPPIDFGRRLKYLIRYPHGCVEQTTSSVFPQLFVMDVMEIDPKFKSQIESNVKAGIKRLMAFQKSSGGLSYWAENSSVNDWGTSYAGHFMLEAEKKGYALPIGFKNNWVRYQKKAARQWSFGQKVDGYYYKRGDLVQAYRLYTLALAGKPELGAMNRMRQKLNKMSPQGIWRLAAAYVLAGKKDVAMNIMQKASLNIPEYKEMSYTYGSADRDRGMLLETMCLLGQQSKAINLVKRISKALSSQRWLSTQTTAYCLIGMAKFADNATSGTLKFSYTLDGKTISASTKMPVSQISVPVDKLQNNEIAVRNTGDKMIYVRLVQTGTPVAGQETASSSNLKMDITYKNQQGQVIDPSRLHQGTNFVAEVTVYNPGSLEDYKEMAISQIFPSGWEILNTRMFGYQTTKQPDIPTYQDIKDDRVYTYFDLNRYKKKTFTVMLHASYTGKYYMPAMLCEAMYDHAVHARTAGKWVEVVKSE